MDKSLDQLSRRERQIMDIIYRLGEASVGDVQKELADDLNYSSVRALMNILKDKGVLKHRQAGRAYIYKPVVAQKKAGHMALNQLVNTFYEGSVESVIAALINNNDKNISEEEYQRLMQLIESKRSGDNNDA